MALALDHLVIHVKNLSEAVSNYQSLGFTVQDGGVHADGITCNALIGFSDDSYLELIAFKKPSAWHPWGRHHRDSYEGFVDFALKPDQLRPLMDRLKAQDLAYLGPIEGGRVAPDGRKLAWQVAFPPSSNLPFLCADIAPQPWRAPSGALRVHANKVQGIASVTLVVNDLAASVQRYRVLLQTEPSHWPQPIAGLGIALAKMALGDKELIFISPIAGSQTPTAQELHQTLAKRGEGLLGASLLQSAATSPNGCLQSLSLSLTHGAGFVLAGR
jgi:hypothetical protein